jgi:hypothetical protein
MRTTESSTKKSSGPIGNFTLTSLSGCQPATMLAACWMLWACTDTQNRALPLRTSTETFIIWLPSFPLSNMFTGTSGHPSNRSLWIRLHQRLAVTKTNSSKTEDKSDEPLYSYNSAF